MLPLDDLLAHVLEPRLDRGDVDVLAPRFFAFARRLGVGLWWEYAGHRWCFGNVNAS